METEAIDNQANLVNYDNENEYEIEDLGYESEEYTEDAHEDDENNHSNGYAKRGITRLCTFRREYGKPGGVKLSVTFDALNRISRYNKSIVSCFLGDMVREHIGLQILSWKKRYFDVDLTVRKLLKGRVNKDGEYQDDEIRSVEDKLKGTVDRSKNGTLAGRLKALMPCTLVFGREKGVSASVSGKWMLNIQEVSPVEIHPINSSADEEGGTTVLGCDQNDASIRKEMQKRETVKSVGAKRTTRSIRKDSSSQDSQSKENVSVLPQAIKCRLWHLKKTTIIAEGTVYKSDGKIMLHNKALPKDCYKVSIDKSLVDAAFIPDVGSNGCTTVLDAVGNTTKYHTNDHWLRTRTAPKVPRMRKTVILLVMPCKRKLIRRRSQKP
ncbi:hypothetical protein Tco_1032398 [Tanacetum coccineum]|uniref:DUF8039 domain-containing protein n=1 Tax=Tanacetum coccineum TaxID=301880 RepID=A0ABQ5GBQ5_9ASTR